MARLPWLLVAALALALGLCSFHRVHLRSYRVPSEPHAPPEDALISLQGSRPVDTDGNEVRAHGGQLLRHAGLYWWVGTSRKVGAALCSTHINIYSAAGLDGGAEGWAHRGAIFSWRQIQGFPDLLPYGHLDHPPPPYRIERPKLWYSPATRRWLLYFHLDTPGFEVPSVGIAATAEGGAITGPYVWQRHFFPDNNTSYDMTVYAEEGTGQAYLVRSCPVMRHAFSRLTADGLSTTGICSSTGLGAEGPAVFRHGGRHYLLASHLTGWDANPPILHESTAPDGGLCATFWRVLPQPTAGPGADTTFNSQSTFVFTHRFADGTPLHLYMGDRWNARGPGGVGNASYVWLPLIPHVGGGGFQLVWAEAWSLLAFKGAQWDPEAQRVLFAPGAAAPSAEQAGAGARAGQALASAAEHSATQAVPAAEDRVAPVPAAESERPNAAALAALPALAGLGEERGAAVLSRAALGSHHAPDTE